MIGKDRLQRSSSRTEKSGLSRGLQRRTDHGEAGARHADIGRSSSLKSRPGILRLLRQRGADAISIDGRIENDAGETVFANVQGSATPLLGGTWTGTVTIRSDEVRIPFLGDTVFFVEQGRPSVKAVIMGVDCRTLHFRSQQFTR
jgi:hypothetical protein